MESFEAAAFYSLMRICILLKEDSQVSVIKISDGDFLEFLYIQPFSIFSRLYFSCTNVNWKISDKNSYENEKFLKLLNLTQKNFLEDFLISTFLITSIFNIADKAISIAFPTARFVLERSDFE